MELEEDQAEAAVGDAELMMDHQAFDPIGWLLPQGRCYVVSVLPSQTSP